MPDDYLCIVGRSKDLIISGGYNIYPKEIESFVDEMDGVEESLAREAFRLASAKLPIQTAFVVRQIGS